MRTVKQEIALIGIPFGMNSAKYWTAMTEICFVRTFKYFDKS